MSEHPVVSWTEAGEARSARWRSESGMPPPKRIVIADDRITADAAYRLACEGTAMLWRGDFQNARQLLQALARRADRKPRKSKPQKLPSSPAESFHLHRQAQSQRARTLAMLLLPLEADYSIPLRRAPDLRQACAEAYGAGDAPSVAFRYPFGETPDAWVPIGLSDPDGSRNGQLGDLGVASRRAVVNALDFLTTDLGMDRAVAYAYLSAAADFEVSQVVDRTVGVHALIPKSHFG